MMSLCFFAVLALMPGPFFLQENVYRRLPLYCFLEKEAGSVPLREDPETYEMIIASNAKYLGEQVRRENDRSLKENGDADNLSVSDDSEEKQGSIQKKADAEKKNSEKAGTEELPQDETEEEKQSQEEAGAEEQSQDEEGVQKQTQRIPEEEVTAAALPQDALKPHPAVDLSAETLADYDYLLGQFYILDQNTSTSAEQLNAARFLAKDLTLHKEPEAPQILIYHSHSQETFADSREGETEDTIVGVGNYLTRLLTENYGYNVIHVTETFDIIDGEIDRSRAYDFSREYVEKVLEENPSIEVIIDLHRDGVPEDRHLVTEINGKDTAQIMFYNGLSYTVNNGPVDYLPNPYIQDNLAFSFQLEYQAALYYPELYRGIYLAGLRYNLHLRPRALLLEAGAQTNTVQEVKNAMEPFADILNRVLQGNR